MHTACFRPPASEPPSRSMPPREGTSWPHRGAGSASAAEVVHSHLCQADSAPRKQTQGPGSWRQAKPPYVPQLEAGRERWHCPEGRSLLPHPCKTPPGSTVLTQKHPHPIPQTQGVASPAAQPQGEAQVGPQAPSPGYPDARSDGGREMRCPPHAHPLPLHPTPHAHPLPPHLPCRAGCTGERT